MSEQDSPDQDQVQPEANDPSAFAAMRFAGRRPGFGAHLIGAILTFGIWMIINMIVFIPLAFVGGVDVMQIIVEQKNWIDIAPEQDPAALLACALILISIILMLPGLWFVVRYINQRAFRTVVTASARFRMGEALKGFLIYLVAMAVGAGVLELFAGSEPELIYDPDRFWKYVPLVLLLTPFQCFAEEVFVRGYLFQAVSTFTRLLALRLIVPALVFTMLHSSNGDWSAGGIWAIVSYFTIAVYLGLVTVKTDGVEHATGIHTANNILAFTLVSTAGAGMPFATVFYDPSPDYMLGYIGLLLSLPIHYFIAFRLLKG